MTEFHVILDTNVLPQDPARRSAFFARLGTLTELGIVATYVPYVVVEELRSQWREKYRKEMRETREAIRVIKSQWIGQTSLDRNISALLEEIQAIEGQIDIPDRIIQETIQQINGLVVPLREHHTSSVIDAYFAGKPPFKSVKNRLDFPDAFIFECIRDVVSLNPGSVCVITGDKGMKKACNQIEGLKLYDSIREFVEDSRVRAVAKAIEDPNATWQDILSQIRTRLGEFDELILKHLQEKEPYIDEVTYREIDHSQFPSDNGEALITGVYEPYQIDIDWDKLEDLELGMISVPFLLRMEADVEFSVFRGDAFDVPDGVFVHYGDFEEESHFESSATVDIEISATLVIEFAWRDYHDSGELLPITEMLLAEIEGIEIIEQEHGGIFQERTGNQVHTGDEPELRELFDD
jgi:rRNA-processing protein FCF1